MPNWADNDRILASLAERLIGLGAQLLGQAEVQVTENRAKTVHPLEQEEVILLPPPDRPRPRRLEMTRKERDDMDRAFIDQITSGK